MLIIDNREGKLIELIKSSPTFNIPYELKNLQIGDIIISSPQHPDKSIIIERKCMADMIASIKDGRYKEQKVRLMAEEIQNPNQKRICYLVEGLIQELKYPTEKKVFHGSLVSSIFRDNIPLIRSSSLNETLDIIIRIHERMQKDIKDFYKPINITDNTTIDNNTIDNTTIDNNTIDNITNTNQINNTYLNSIKKCKKDNLTPQLWNQISLTNIPGVSTSIATKISEVFPTLKKLFEAYDNCELNEERILLISEIILTNNGKTKRRIGEVISKRILQYIYKEEENVVEENIVEANVVECNKEVNNV